MENSFNIITNYLPDRIRAPLIRALSTCQRATEIVLRTDRPLCVYESHRLLFVTAKGLVTDSFSVDHLLTASASEIESIVLKLCDHSVYAYQNEINSGFITIGGGVRVGICGKAVMTDGKLTNVRDISTLCFRIARDVHHCANQLLSLINPLDGALICGVPGSGKTTMIRDMARQLFWTSGARSPPTAVQSLLLTLTYVISTRVIRKDLPQTMPFAVWYPISLYAMKLAIKVTPTC